MVTLTLAILLDTLTSPASPAVTYRRHAVYSRPVRPMDAHCWEYSTHVPRNPVRPGTRVPRRGILGHAVSLTPKELRMGAWRRIDVPWHETAIINCSFCGKMI